ncbi:hypothetical protein BRC92_10245 [Halobacteriales archaeon QS_4_69_31]|nr:MAG: hypothetical protein BRC92_10245 [Halobacteriales archaeon QS_4_69_31]
METWTWILVYLVGFTLFQLLLFRYFSDGGSVDRMSLGSGETAGPNPIERGQPARETGQQSDHDHGGVDCPHCGALNDDAQPYTYCRNCLAQLR